MLMKERNSFLKNKTPITAQLDHKKTEKILKEKTTEKLIKTRRIIEVTYVFMIFLKKNLINKRVT